MPQPLARPAILNVMIEVSDEELAELIEPGAVVLIGEVHGTCQFPQLVGRLVELAVERGVAVLVGLEVPIREQPALDAFLAGAGEPGDVTALTASSFWHRPRQYDDGRAGAGLVDLLVTARAASAGGPVRVFGFDQPWGWAGTVATPEEAAILNTPRDQFMAETAVAAIERWTASQGSGFTVLLAGSIHSRIVRYPEIDEPHLGELLVERFPQLVTLEGHWSGGQFRAATSPQGAEVHDAGAIPTPAGSIGRHHRDEAVQRYGHHGWVNVGLLTPSLPIG